MTSRQRWPVILVLLLATGCGEDVLQVAGEYRGTGEITQNVTSAPDSVAARLFQSGSAITGTFTLGFSEFQVTGDGAGGGRFDIQLVRHRARAPDDCPIVFEGEMLIDIGRDGRLTTAGSMFGADCLGVFTLTYELTGPVAMGGAPGLLTVP